MYYKFIFCILVYKNTEDIIGCLKSIDEKITNYKVVIVNSFYDEQSDQIFQEIAKNNGCDYLSVENKGYGYGNNRGIAYIRQKYKYDYIIISNPDVEIKKFDETMLTSRKQVYAPIIRNLKKKEQNPYWFIRNKFSEYCIYQGFRKKNMVLYYFGVLINKLYRVTLLQHFFSNRAKNKVKIYAAHGSFIVIGASVIEQFDCLFDENMFLFAEEAYLAYAFSKRDVEVFLTKAIEILHKEDGSMQLVNIDEMAIQRESFLYYYEKYIK